MQSYDYEKRSGVETISWPRFAELAALLAEQLARHRIDAVVGIARAGLFPAAAIACALRCDLFPVRVSRREQDRVVRERPAWIMDVPPDVAGRRVAVVDDIADSGETLALVAVRVQERGASSVVTAAPVSHSWAAPPPDVVALTSDALIIFPWDRQVYAEGRWQLHPELEAALALQSGGEQEP